VPRTGLRVLQLFLPVTTFDENFENGPIDYWQFLVNNPQSGGWISELRSRQLIEGAQLTFHTYAKGVMVAELSIALTEQALKQYDEVLRVFFQFIDHTMEYGASEHNDTYQQMQTLQQIDNMFQVRLNFCYMNGFKNKN